MKKEEEEEEEEKSPNFSLTSLSLSLSLSGLASLLAHFFISLSPPVFFSFPLSLRARFSLFSLCLSLSL